MAAESAHISRLQTLIYKFDQKKNLKFDNLPPLAFLSSPLARASPGTNSSGNTLSKYLGIPVDDHFQQDTISVLPFERLALEVRPELFTLGDVTIITQLVADPVQ